MIRPNEKAIIGSLILHPELAKLKKNILSKELFSKGYAQQIFDAIKTLSDNGNKIDEFSVSELSSISVEDVMKWTDGVHKIPVENFEYHVKRLWRSRLEEQLFSHHEKQRNFFLKGIDPDFTQIFSILDQIRKEDVGKERPRAETLKEFLSRDLPKRKTLIEPILGLQEMTMIHGRPKIGKSLLTLQLARCLITGEDWLGFKVYKPERPILIIQVELAPTLMQERAQKVFKNIAGSEKIVIPFQSRNIFLDQEDGREHVLSLIKDYKPALVILDPYSKFFTDEEMALKNPRPFFDFWQEQIDLQALSLLFVHHDAKFQEGKLGGQKALGTTSINASTDNNWSVERILDVGLDPVEFLRTARLSFESRNWQNTRPIDLRLNDNLAFDITILPKSSVDEWDIVEEIDKAGGQIGQKELIKHYSNVRAFYQAKNKAIEKDLIDEVKLENVRGKPVMIMLKNRGA